MQPLLPDKEWHPDPTGMKIRATKELVAGEENLVGPSRKKADCCELLRTTTAVDPMAEPTNPPE